MNFISYFLILALSLLCIGLALKLKRRNTLDKAKSDDLQNENISDHDVSSEKYSCLINATHDAVIEVDLAGNIKSVNKQALDILEYYEDILINKSIHEILHCDNETNTDISECPICSFHSSGDLNPKKMLNLAVYNVNGDPVTVHLCISPIINDGVITGFMHIMQDTREIQAAQRDIEKGRWQLQMLIDTSPIGLFISSDKEVLLQNAKAAELSNVELGDDEGLAFVSNEVYTEVLEKVKEQGIVVSNEVQMYAKDGSIKDILLSALYAYWENKLSMLYWLVDISRLKQTEQELLQAINEVTDANKAKDNFLACMSHEIRTPMNAIVGMSYLCQQTDLSIKQKEYLSTIDKAAKNLLTMIDDILDFSELGSSQPSESETEFTLETLVSGTKSLAQNFGHNKDIEFTINVSDKMPEKLYGNQRKINQVFFALLHNAFKFTNSGDVKVSIEPQNIADNKIQILATVTDTGSGIRADELDSLFQPFNINGYMTREHGGTGLGLALSKKIVESMQGTISATSTYGKGSEFKFTMVYKLSKDSEPAIDAIQVQPAALIEKEAKPDNYVPNILLVEDNDINQEIAVELLNGMGDFNVEVANNGEEALQKATSQEFDLILMDIQMPIMDGLTASQKIRESGYANNATTPIIAMTAHSSDSDRAKSISAGMNGHIVKPINPNSLSETVFKWLGIEKTVDDKEVVEVKVLEKSAADLALEKEFLEEAAKQNEIKKKEKEEKSKKEKTKKESEKNPNDFDSLYGIEAEAGLANVAGNQKLYKDLLTRFNLKYKDSGKEIRLLMSDEKYEEAARLAHTVKGVAANLGAVTLAEIAGGLEKEILNEKTCGTLPSYNGELALVNFDIGKLITEGNKVSHTGHEKLAEDRLEELKVLLAIIPAEMERDWTAAQVALETFNDELMETEAANDFEELIAAVDNFETDLVVELADKVITHFE